LEGVYWFLYVKESKREYKSLKKLERLLHIFIELLKAIIIKIYRSIKKLLSR